MTNVVCRHILKDLRRLYNLRLVLRPRGIALEPTEVGIKVFVTDRMLWFLRLQRGYPDYYFDGR